MENAMLDVKALLSGAERQKDFDSAIDLSGDGFEEFVSPASFKGRVTNMSGYILFEGNVVAEYKTFCSFCLKPLDRTLEVGVSMPVAQTLENLDTDEYIIAEGGMIDLGELARSAVILNMPSRELCREECKGLCPKCGKDKNVGECSCKVSEPDPRWQKLRDLLGDD